jgi:type IV fimbrial biogenesis protein FimT
MKQLAQRRQIGASLVESLIVLVITAVMASIALPSFDSARARRHLDGSVAQLETEINYARGLAIARNEMVRISFESAAGASCYVVHSGLPGDCSCIGGGAAACKGSAQDFKTTSFSAKDTMSVASNSRSIGFSPHWGTVTPTATMALSNKRSEVVNLVVNVMGRVRSCTPMAALSGYVTC